VSTRKRHAREAGQYRLLAAEYRAVAKDLEITGHRDVAAVFRRRAAANDALAEGTDS